MRSTFSRSTKYTRRRQIHLQVHQLCVEHLESRLLLASNLPPVILHDINELIPGSNPTEIVKSGEKIFIAADDKIHGRELFVTDGSSPPSLVKDVMPGFSGSDPGNLTDVDGILFFTANDGEHGVELWKSNGTEAGTSLVADIFPGASEFFGFNSSNPTSLTAALTPSGAKLFFVASNDDIGTELWTADAGGAEFVLDIYSGEDEFNNPHSSEPRDLTFRPEFIDEDSVTIPPALFFSAEDGTNGRELWKTELDGGGMQTGILKNIFQDEQDMEPNSSNPGELILFQNLIFFRAAGGEFDENDELILAGTELWKTDGTSEGTVQLIDIYPGSFTNPQQEVIPRSSAPNNFAIYNDLLYFAATTGPSGRELWKTDGTEANTSQVRNIRSGSLSSSPADLTSTDGFLFFSADGGQGREIWRTDGTSIETKITRDIRPGSASSLLFQRGLAKIGNSIVFGANDNVLGPEVWISDGTLEGTHILKEIQFGRNSSTVPEAFSSIDDMVFFEASGELWRTDGTEPNTIRLDLDTEATESSLPQEIVSAGGTAFFIADDGVHGVELWKSDGTSTGTTLVHDITPGTEIIFNNSSLATPISTNPEDLTAVGDNVFFRVSFSTGSELWRSDGTPAGTVSVKDVEPRDLTSFAGKLFFAADSPNDGRELWMSDGSTAGTVVFANIAEGGAGSFPQDLTVVGDKLFFVADDGDGNELWVSDGVGTTLLDIAPEGGSFPRQLTPGGSSLFFRANDGENGTELWTSDGTPEGTVMLGDIKPGSSGSFPILLSNIGSTFFFFADDGEIGQALWKTDGTPEGTTIVKDIFPGDDEFFLEEGESTVSVATLGNKLYFSADDGEHGVEIWTTDGTTEGTQLFKDLFPGEESSFPEEYLTIDDTLYFSAAVSGSEVDEFGDLPSLGHELWSSDGTAVGTDVLADINVLNDAGSNPQELNNVGETLIFVADDGIKGHEPWIIPVQLDSVVVNSIGDDPDNDLQDGICNTGNFVEHNGQQEAECTLRAAIMNSNANGGEEIHFDIPAAFAADGRFTIRPNSGLDEIVEPIIIDGTTQDEFENKPVIEIDGSQTLTGTSGLVITAGNSTISGLVINRFGSQLGGRGIKISGGGSNVIVGNFIGTDASGMEVDPDGTPNSGDEFGNNIGIEISGSSQNRIGSHRIEDRNIISGNRLSGVDISGSSAGRNEVLGNLIGTSVDGLEALGNLGAGVFISNAPSNRVGGAAPGEGNVISANGDGVRINSSGATMNEVLGNRIGTDINGEVALSNRLAGVAVINAPGNIIGAPGEDARNIISGNLHDGVLIEGGSATNNIVRGNYVGLDHTGEKALGNIINGIHIKGARENQIGAKLAGEARVTGNVIADSDHGVLIEGFSIDNIVVGNLIGTDATGTITDPDSESGTGDELGHLFAGVKIDDGRQNRIGITASGESDDSTRNVIAGSFFHGINIRGENAFGNRVGNNFIGTDIAGMIPLGQMATGVLIEDAPNNIVGLQTENFDDECDADSPGNTIVGNRDAGVRIDGDTAIGNSIRCNSIFANEGLGIDLVTDGTIANDLTDEDSGPNKLQNFPIISLVDRVGPLTKVSGTLSSTADTEFVVDFYATDVSEATQIVDAQQGGRPIGSIAAVTDGAGYVSFLANDLAMTTSNEVITATATNSSRNSSRFSPFTPDLAGADGFEVRTPVLLVPGIFGSFPFTTLGSAYKEFLLTLGIEPGKLQLDPIANYYDDIVNTLQTAGYELGTDLFLAPYDWRISLAPNTGAIAEHDGVITGVSGASLTDDKIEYGMDYLAFQIKNAAEEWYRRFHQPLSNVHIIAHSMGGVLSRTYMQSTAYGDLYSSIEAGLDLPLPVVSNFTMLGVPNQGGIGPWNGWNDNFVANPAYRLVLSKMISHAWNKLQSGEEISYQSDFGDVIRKSDFEGLSEQEAKIRFVRRYTPGLADLLPSFEGFAVNFDPSSLSEFKNRLLVDLNEETLFADRVARTVAMYGTSETTPAQVRRQIGGEFLPDLIFNSFEFDEILSFTEYIARDPRFGEVYYEEIGLEAHGDGTVAIESLEGLFINDDRVELLSFCSDTCRPNDFQTLGEVSHTLLPSNIDAQSIILDSLHHPLPPGNISVGSSVSDITVVLDSAGFDFFNFFVDPVDEAFLVDEQGNRLGFSTATGAVAEIPNSIYIGGTDGAGWILGPIDGALRLQLTGSGEEHVVQVTAFEDGNIFGADSTGFLDIGETRSIDIIPPAPEPLSVRIIAPFDENGVIEGSSIDALVRTTGDMPAERIDFFVEDQLVGSLTSEPFEFQFDVPLGSEQLRLRAVAVDSDQQESTLESTLRVFQPSFITNDSLVAGSDAGQPSIVRVFESDGTERFSFFAYDPSFLGGVRVATGDVNGDGTVDIITGIGPGAVPMVKVFDGVNGSEIHKLFAYDLSFTGGVFVASGDINGDGFDDIITSAGPGIGQPIKVFDGSSGDEINSFFAYDPTFTGGVFVASGDVDGDGRDNIITGAGPGGGPHVKVFDGESNELINFFAYDPSFTGGVRVATGDVNGDGLSNILTGAGAGGGPHVKVFDGESNELSSFFAYDSAFQSGVFVAGGDVNQDGFDDIITGTGSGVSTQIKIFDHSSDTELHSFFAYDPNFTGGVFVAGIAGSQILPEVGDSNRDGRFNVFDILQVLVAGKYSTGEQATFEEGDWNRDGFFNVFDIILALTEGNFEGSSQNAELLETQTSIESTETIDRYHQRQEEILGNGSLEIEAGIIESIELLAANRRDWLR